MTDRIGELESALRAQAALNFEAQTVLTVYLAKDLEPPALFERGNWQVMTGRGWLRRLSVA